MKLSKDFYLREDVVQISKDLLGKFLLTNIDGVISGGMIVETEAYCAPDDRASHAFNNKKTDRTKTMFMEGGISYVYLCYGIHHLFNVVTNIEEIPHAILIRAIEPTDGIETLLRRRNMDKLEKRIAAGPGAMSKALGIGKLHNALSLESDQVWIEDRGLLINRNQIMASTRVGVDYAGEDAKLPWRFRIKNNPFVSKAK
ncbi:DNA-3-methyladenine glycosylase [Solitalea koreensis]|uniref:Putative 3-methyladenine DNA glycosylase n=1 Tax=Solitalea koreensis TaxID=543615 RepID=A0A521BD42_9SPHI|nr:DNA-3-methyladenine glycosylase [Solitalea koreensis]SMO45025.1 DNA-3-methyladenine glycosylase [Solitalea koreensis]